MASISHIQENEKQASYSRKRASIHAQQESETSSQIDLMSNGEELCSYISIGIKFLLVSLIVFIIFTNN